MSKAHEVVIITNGIPQKTQVIVGGVELNCVSGVSFEDIHATQADRSTVTIELCDVSVVHEALAHFEGTNVFGDGILQEAVTKYLNEKHGIEVEKPVRTATLEQLGMLDAYAPFPIKYIAANDRRKEHLHFFFYSEKPVWREHIQAWHCPEGEGCELGTYTEDEKIPALMDGYLGEDSLIEIVKANS